MAFLSPHLLLPLLDHDQLRSNLLATQPFKDVFGPNKKRKKPRLASESLASLVETAEQKEDT
jgi:nuclear GTP-binding protein